MHVLVAKLLSVHFSGAKKAIESPPQVAAYEETLGRHHGLVVKSVFSVAIKRSPNRDAIMQSN